MGQKEPAEDTVMEAVLITAVAPSNHVAVP